MLLRFDNVLFSFLCIVCGCLDILMDLDNIFALFVNLLVDLLSHSIRLYHQLLCIIERLLSFAYHSFLKVNLAFNLHLLGVQQLLL